MYKGNSNYMKTPDQIPTTTNHREQSGRSYSRFVALMRIALPATAGAIIILVIIWPQIGEKSKNFQLGFSSIKIEDAGGQHLINPRFSSTDSKQQPFNLTAKIATQQKSDPNLVELTLPRADLTSKTGTWIALSAKSGLYNRGSETLKLQGTVNLFHDSGYELSTNVANLNLAKGTAEGNLPITGHGPSGTIKGTGFKIVGHGKKMIFTGKSKLIIYPVLKGP